MTDIAKKSEGEAFERVKTARHPERPYLLDYIELLFEDFTELRGDRRFSDDPAIVSGIASFHGRSVTVIGQQKGRDTKQRRFRNFAMTKPEGYRKAARVMCLAEKFERPIITFIDTPGAYPGIDAEERGQAEAIAHNLAIMARLNVPTVVVVIGEGGSGGALAIGVGDAILMLENSIYSVISPEGCAAILWKDSSMAPRAAEALKVTAKDLLQLGLIDKVIAEPTPGAHQSVAETVSSVDVAISESLQVVCNMNPEQRIARRYRRLREYGAIV